MAVAPDCPITYRFQCALACPVAQRCDELAVIIDQSSFKDVQTLFPLLVENVFGFGNQPGWGLKQLNRNIHQRDFDVVRRFLNPDGALMRLVDKLMHDVYLKYEFPISCLPTPVCQSFLGGIVPPFYSNKMQAHSPGKLASYLSLNPFEFFIFHLAYFMLGTHAQKSSLEWATPGDSLYAYVIEDYLHYFLPCDGGFTPAPSYLAASPVNQHSPHQVRNRNESRRSNLNMSSSPLQCLIKTPPIVRQISTSSLTPKDAGQGELWRTDVFSQSLIEFWLNHYSSEPPRNVFSSSDVLHKHSIPERYSYAEAGSLGSTSSLSFETFFPSSDHIRLVRMFIKHIHYFCNSARLNSMNIFDDFKRSFIPHLLQKKMYNFTKHLFDHWPLDASFRLVLEMWLSYIQPWRYIDIHALHSPSREKVEEKERIILSKWKPFVEENLIFYGVFFQKMIPRLLRVDLSSPKNANMLHRLTKVFAQVNLRPMILEAEEMQLTPVIPAMSFSRLTGSSLLSRSAAAAGHASIIRQHINELESPSFTYVTMFGDEVTNQVKQLLVAVSHAKESVYRSRKRSKKRQRGFFSAFFHSACSMIQFSHYWSVLDDDCWATNGHRVEQYLEIATNQLVCLFEPQVIENLNHLLRQTESNVSTFQSMISDLQEEDDDGPEDVMTPLRRYKLITRQEKPVPSYQGDPDLQPIRSFEIAFLVRMFFQISTMLNDRYGNEIQQLYERDDLLGRVCRQLIQPPTVCVSYANHSMPSPVRKRILPARVSLRPLAHQQSIGYILSFFGIGWVFGYSFVGTAVFLIFCMGVILFCKAALGPYFTVGTDLFRLP